MACPDGLEPGLGLRPPTSSSICVTRSYFGLNNRGLEVYASGSGMLLRSGRTRLGVLTAGHNLYDHGLRRRAIWVAAYFDRSGQSYSAVRSGEDANDDYVLPAEFTDGVVADPEWDFGLLRISPLSASAYPGIPIEMSSAASPTRKMITGYPDEGDCREAFVPYHSIFEVVPSGPNTYGYAGQETYLGMSGAPLLTTDRTTGGIRSFGHHIRGGHTETMRAVRYSRPVFDRISGWG